MKFTTIHVMDKPTEKIISNIASIQLEAIITIAQDRSIPDDLAFQYLEIPSESQWDEAVETLRELYIQMIKMPTMIRMLSEYQLLICSHILYRMEDVWMIDNSEGVFGAWSEIHAQMKKFHPEFTLSHV